MKTQLLEDIAQSAAVSLTPSKPAGHATAGKQAQQLAAAGTARPARPRSAVGVWRQKPAAEPLAPTTQALEEAPPLELNKVFEEIAALEAQFVLPGQQLAPALAPVDVQRARPAAPVAPVHLAANPSAEAIPAPNPTPGAAPPPDPLFDFTPPAPARQAADPFTPAQSGRTRSRPRYLLWAACVLSGALLIQGGRWFYQEHRDAGSLALIAGEAKQAPRVDQDLKQGPLEAQAATLEQEADAGMPPVPPLVMLAPDPPAASKIERQPPLAASGAKPQAAPKAGQAAQPRPASPAPKPSSRQTRERSGAAAGPAKERPKREPVRQLARASAPATERPSRPDTSLAATLKACREHGYHATQCIKRECGVGKYGFACRGR
jgi:hypothetical protein